MQSIRQNPQDPLLNASPYAFYERLRAKGELVFWEDYGMPMATSHALVQSLLKDRRFGREAPAFDVPDHLRPFYDIEAHSMLELDPPRHTRLRKLVLHAFTSRRIKELEPMIRAECRQRIAAFPEGPFDLLAQYAEPIPVTIIARLLGVPDTMCDQLLAWSHDMVAMYMAGRDRRVEDTAAQAASAFATFIRGYIDARRNTPRDDLITQLIAAEEDGAHLSTDEMITTCILLLNAGHEATVHTIGNGVLACLKNDCRDVTEGLIEEILRYDPPLHMFTRWAKEDVEVMGHSFAKGDPVGLLLGAANHDPKVYDRPATFDPTRRVVAHTAFGGGIHFCVGAPLARLELKIALEELFAARPTLRLEGSPGYKNAYHFHGLERLTVS
ncbi:cytochrome P450 [Nereida sp. MMG025]|uniref:cytochrome P450 n=1 Tax=Nereida sp. MMG025 TaxID=2909981 RepID=UPI001F3CA507|nr:cytochrome P450 [Nereida sp. MMG025]MCF6445369.1 cytochrome P450 [Nereida sp. MMG025]